MKPRTVADWTRTNAEIFCVRLREVSVVLRVREANKDDGIVHTTSNSGAIWSSARGLSKFEPSRSNAGCENQLITVKLYVSRPNFRSNRNEYVSNVVKYIRAAFDFIRLSFERYTG